MLRGGITFLQLLGLERGDYNYYKKYFCEYHHFDVICYEKGVYDQIEAIAIPWTYQLNRFRSPKPLSENI